MEPDEWRERMQASIDEREAAERRTLRWLYALLLVAAILYVAGTLRG